METRDSDQMNLDRHALLQLIQEMENNDEFTKQKLHEPIKNYDHDKVMKYVKAFHNIYFHVLDEKGKVYDSSWQKRGEYLSIWGNLLRKYDRLENLMKGRYELDAEGLSELIKGEPFHDTLMDLANYSVLWDAYRVVKYLEWLNENEKTFRWGDSTATNPPETKLLTSKEREESYKKLKKITGQDEFNGIVGEVPETDDDKVIGDCHMAIRCNKCDAVQGGWPVVSDDPNGDMRHLYKGINVMVDFAQKHLYCTTSDGFTFGYVFDGLFKPSDFKLTMFHVDAPGKIMDLEILEHMDNDGIEAYAFLLTVKSDLINILKPSYSYSQFKVDLIDYES